MYISLKFRNGNSWIRIFFIWRKIRNMGNLRRFQFSLFIGQRYSGAEENRTRPSSSYRRRPSFGCSPQLRYWSALIWMPFLGIMKCTMHLKIISSFLYLFFWNLNILATFNFHFKKLQRLTRSFSFNLTPTIYLTPLCMRTTDEFDCEINRYLQAFFN